MRKINNYKQIFASLLLNTRKYVKGSISLFLALIVTPLLGMTLLMVESIRYQDVIEEMIEISDLSSFATLANYDPFLKERFGLLAVSQDEKLKAFYERYFSENRKLIDNDVFVEKVLVEGKYSFEDLDILEQQLIDYTEFSSIFESFFEGLDISEILKNINKACDAEDLNRLGKELTLSAKISKNIATAYSTVDEAITFINEEYNPALEDYKDAYDDFEESLNAYIEVLNEYDEDDKDIYKKDDVKKAWDALTSTADSPQRKYKKACHDLAGKIKDLDDKVAKVLKALEDASNDMEKLTKELDSDTDGGLAGFNFPVSVANAIIPMAGKIQAKDFDNYAKKTREKLKAMETAVWKMKMKDFDYDSSTDDTKDDWYVEVPDNITDVVTALKDFKSTFDEITIDDQLEYAKDLINLVTSLADMPGIVEGNLYAVIKSEKNEDPFSFESVYNPKLAAEQLVDLVEKDGIEGIFKQDNNLANAYGIIAIAQFLEVVRRTTFPKNPFEVLLVEIELTISTTALVVAFTLWVTNILVNQVLFTYDFFTEKAGKLDEAYKHYLLAAYGAYNFPNRTNYMKKLKFTDYNYGKKMYNEVCGRTLTNPGLFDYIEAGNSFNVVQMLINACLGNGFFPKSNSDTFYGAESEYLLIGWKNEVYNQCGAFYNILMLRMLVNLIPLLTDKDVRDEAKCAGAYAWIIYILVLLGDSMLDTFILSNGGKVSFIKQKCYLTKEGAKELWKDLSETSDLAKSIRDVMGKYDSWKGTAKKPDDSKGSWWAPKADYSFHMFILLLLCTHYEDLLERMQNVVINESVAYYKYQCQDFKFSNTYTYVYSDITYKINPMFDFSSLTDNPIVSESIELKRYIGY